MSDFDLFCVAENSNKAWHLRRLIKIKCINIVHGIICRLGIRISVA